MSGDQLKLKAMTFQRQETFGDAAVKLWCSLSSACQPSPREQVRHCHVLIRRDIVSWRGLNQIHGTGDGDA